MQHPVILFDGVCNFCDATVNLIIRHDKQKVFRFAPLQSRAGQKLLSEYNLSTTDFDSFVLIMDGKAYKKTNAALRIYPKLGGRWHLMKLFWIIPRFLRDAGYSLIAKNRYRWFGKKEACMMPSPDVKSRFLN